MSYTLDIWQPPAGQPPPADLPGVVALVQRLRGELSGPNPRFRQLLERLTRRYPDITSDEAADLPEHELAWSDGPLSADGHGAVFVLGLLTQLLGEVRPFVIAEANALGLAVFDGQAAEAFFPGGIRRAARAEPAREQESETEKKQYAPEARVVGAAVFERMARVFEPAGFRPRKPLMYKRPMPGGSQTVQVVIDDEWPTACQFSLLTKIRFDAVSDLCVALVLPDLLPKDAASWPTGFLRQENWLQAKAPFIEPRDHDYRITSTAELQEALAHLEAQCASVLLPILEGGKTVAGLDQAMNTSPLTASPFFERYDSCFVNIVLAYFAGNPRLPALCEEVLAKATGQVGQAKAQTCADYVLSHPLPDTAR